MEEARISKQKSKFSSRKSNRSSPTDEIVREYKNIIQDRKKRQILILCTDLAEKSKSKHVVDSAVALNNYGHKITIVTSCYEDDIYPENLSQVNIVQAGRWIPKNISGCFSEVLYFLRSLYTTIYMLRASRKIQPKVSVILCETNCFMIPIIKAFTNYKTIVFRYEFELAKMRLPAKDITVRKSWIVNQSLRNADQVLVPNKVFFNIYKRSFGITKLYPTICEPYLNVRQLKKEKLLPVNQILESFDNNTLMFLVLAEYHPRNNLELSLDAFHLLLHSVDHETHSRLRLVVAGHSGHRHSYLRRLIARARRLQLGAKIMLRPRPSRQHKKALLAGCVATLHCAEHGLWDRYVLEAMALGRPVIAVDNGFTGEILDNGVTGYIVPPKPENFSAAMSEILFNPGKGEFIGKMAHCEFIKKYSMEAFASRLNKIVSNFFDKTQANQTENCSEINFENNELFFG